MAAASSLNSYRAGLLLDSDCASFVVCYSALLADDNIFAARSR